MSPLIQAFGVAVRQCREARGWSQERLAEYSDLSRSYVGEIERGSVIASLATVEKLAKSMDMNSSALLMRGETLCQKNSFGLRLTAIAC